MAAIEWYRCKFLESSDNLKPLVRKRFGREPSSSTSREIVACLQQGRLFYESASSSPLEIRPLQQFYGMVGFAKAVIIASQHRRLSTLQHSHGISDVSRGNSRIADLQVRIESAGTFQEFNDVVAPLARFSYVDWRTVRHDIYSPAATSAQVVGISLSLRDIRSRIPGLASVYEMTFGDLPQTGSMFLNLPLEDEQLFQLAVEDPRQFTDRESVRELVTSWRSRFPFMRKWRVQSAQLAYRRSIISFRNFGNVGIEEFSEEYLADLNGRFEERPVPNDINELFLLEEGLDAVGGGYTGGLYAIAPINGVTLSEFSLQYLGLFLLSSLVRYRPQTWTAAISGSSIAGEPTDDRALSLIERFLNLNAEVVPEMVVKLINPTEDQ